jgi:hypothetical protein
MTWTRALLYLAIWGVLSAYYVAFERSPQEPSTPPEPSAQATRFIPFRGEAVNRLSLDVHGTRLRCELRDGQWNVVEPVDSRIPADLIAAIVATLTELPPVDAVPLTAGARPADFGLEEESVRLTLGTGTEEARLQLGARNPSQTAIYARRDGAEEIVLIGLNVQYYVDLLIEASRQPRA